MWSDSCEAMIEALSKGKPQEFFIENENWRDLMIDEINAMTNVDLVELMESAGLVVVR